MGTRDKRAVLVEYLAAPTVQRLERVYRVYRSFCLRRALAVTRDIGAAEDATQNLFLEFLRQPPAPGTYEKPEAYLADRVQKRALDWVRDQCRRRGALRRAWFARRRTGHSAYAADLQEAIATLPPEIRQVIFLRYYLSLGLKETASVLGLDSSTVSRYAARGVRILKARIGPTSLGLLALIVGQETRGQASTASEVGLLHPRLCRLTACSLSMTAKLSAILLITALCSVLAIDFLLSISCKGSVLSTAGNRLSPFEKTVEIERSSAGLPYEVLPDRRDIEEPLPMVTGSVFLWASEEPVAGATIAPAGARPKASTNRDGSFSFSVRRGSVRELMIECEGYTPSRVLVEDESSKLSPIFIIPKTFCRARVVDSENGAPLQDVVVSILETKGHGVSAARTASDGVATMALPPVTLEFRGGHLEHWPPKYELHVSADAYESRGLEIPLHYLVAAQESLLVLIHRAVECPGLVVGELGEPVPGAWLR